MRNRALIAHWVMAHAQGAIQLIKRDGKSHVQINDYPALRTWIGTLLAEVQRIKSEGDLAAAQELVETYGIKVEPQLHEEVRARYQALNLAPYKGFINPVYTPVTNAQGELTDITVSYTEAYDRQMLRYSHDYATLPYEN